MKFLFFSILFLLLLFHGAAQSVDTIYWRPCNQLQFDDFKGLPDTTTIQLANSYIRVNYSFHIVNGQLQSKVNCFFLKRSSWAKYNMPALMEHEQTHFDIAKLFASKLEERFKTYKLSDTGTVLQDLTAIYDGTMKELYAMSDLFDKIESQNPNTDIPQKQFEAEIKKQLPAFI